MEWFRILEQPFRMWGHSPVVRYPDGDRKAYHECFRVILEHGADPNVQGRFNSRLLHFLMAAGSSRGKVIMTEPERLRFEPERLRFAQILVEFGAALDPRDDLLKSTPLRWACRWGRREVVEFLLGPGASPRESEAEPWARPLAWAEKRGHLEVAWILRKAGATGKA